MAAIEDFLADAKRRMDLIDRGGTHQEFNSIRCGPCLDGSARPHLHRLLRHRRRSRASPRSGRPRHVSSPCNPSTRAR